MPIFKLNDNLITKSVNTRLYGVENPIIGLTGGIASGKSTASQFLSNKGYTVIDADKLVKVIYSTNEALLFIQKISPSSVKRNTINFKLLREHFFSDPKLKEKVESFVFLNLKKEFLKKLPDDTKTLVFYDAPLLFEKELDKKVDQTLLIYAPREVQLKRLLKRDNISAELANKILDSQNSIEEKKRKANFIIDNTSNKSELKDQIDFFLRNNTK